MAPPVAENERRFQKSNNVAALKESSMKFACPFVGGGGGGQSANQFHRQHVLTLQFPGALTPPASRPFDQESVLSIVKCGQLHFLPLDQQISHSRAHAGQHHSAFGLTQVAGENNRDHALEGLASLGMHASPAAKIVSVVARGSLVCQFL